jgi:PAS domain S-box-containing protein
MTDQERVLLVDDDKDLLYTMEIALRRNGYSVTSFDDPFLALEALRAEKPFSVMITDLMMPGINGISLIQNARQIDPNLESIVITAAGTIETAILALRDHGAYDYLLKPFETMVQLSVAVARAAEHRRLRLEHEALQARLKAEAEWLQALISNTGDAILSADSSGVLAVVNPSAVRLLGRGDLIGRLAFTCLPPALAKIVAHWETTGKQHSATIEIPWSDGTLQFVSLTPVIRKGKSWQGWVMVIRDITHLKKLDEVKAQMLTEAALKIRYPLAEAMNSLANLNTFVEQGTRAGEIIYKLNKIWGRVLGWTDDLINLVRIDSSLDSNPTEIDLTSILSDFEGEFLRTKFASNRLQLEPDLPADLPKIKADRKLFLKLLEQIMIRAANRTASGGIISIRANCKEGEVWIEVCDQGPEINENDLLHLFDTSSIRMNTGSLHTGLELATVKALVKKMEGQVWIGGPGPKGSSITLCLPVAK